MLFVIDVGNTNLVLGIYEGDELRFSYRMSTDRTRSSDEIGFFFLQILQNAAIRTEQIEDVIISSVVPPIMHALENAVRKYIKKEPIVITSATPLPMKILLDNPFELGADRIVNAIAAYELYGGPLIVIDFGTATTFCAVAENGDYLGGIIYPGLKISVDALVERTAKLPKIEIVHPERVIGKNTVQSMQSGLVHGYAGMVDSLVRKMAKEMNVETVNVVATGGLSVLISKETETISHINRDLTLTGLKLIYQKYLKKKETKEK